MSKQSDKIFCFVRLVCVFFLFWGCGKEEPPPKPKIVSKKIVREKDATVTPAQPAAIGDQPKATSEKPVVAQKPADTSKPSAEKTADQKKSSDVSKHSADKLTEKPVEKTGDNIADQKKAAEIPKPSADKVEKTEDKSEEKSAAKIAETSQKPSDQKTDLVFPDISALEKEVNKAVAAFNGKTRVDPFAPLFKEEPKKPPKGKDDKKPDRPKSPLETFDLSQLKLVGIVRGISDSKALVEESSGKGYIIKKGTLIGQNSGRVSEILDDKIIIEEEQEDIVGNEIDGWSSKVTVRKREMKLQKNPGDEL